jgi:hypothetical protein
MFIKKNDNNSIIDEFNREIKKEKNKKAFVYDQNFKETKKEKYSFKGWSEGKNMEILPKEIKSFFKRMERVMERKFETDEGKLKNKKKRSKRFCEYSLYGSNKT